MTRDVMRYILQIEMLEPAGAPSEARAIALLRSEFALAQNAGRFAALTPGDIQLGDITRSTPQEGVTRYDVELLVEERKATDNDRAAALLCRAFTNALNASYFQRVCDEGLTMRLLAREPAAAPALRSAA